MRGKKCSLLMMLLFAAFFVLSVGFTAKAEESGSGDKYTITFVACNGVFGVDQSTKEIVVSSGDAIGNVADPYDLCNKSIFAGWYSDSSFSAESRVNDISSYIPEADMILFAKFIELNETNCSEYEHVTFNFKGGKINNETPFIDGSDEEGVWYISAGKTFEEIGAPSVYRYESAHTGWFYDEACTKEVVSTDIVQGGETFYAGWTTDYYMLALDAGDGHFLVNGEPNRKLTFYIQKGDKCILSTDYYYTDDGRIIEGWYEDKALSKKIELDGDYYTPTEDTTIYAKWEKGCAVTFDYGIAAEKYSGDDYCHTLYFKQNSMLNRYTNMVGKEFENKVFDGWYLDKECTKNKVEGFGGFQVTGDVTFYAKWTDGFKITCDAGDGHFADGSTTKTGMIVMGDTLDTRFAAFSNDKSKALVGWALKKGGEPIESNLISPDSDCTLYAVYSEGCTVTFDGNGGQITGYYVYNPDHTYDWCSMDEPSLTLTLPKDITISSYAPFNYCQSISTTAPDAGKAFKGWSTSKSAEDIIDFASYKLTESSITLYAIWDAKNTLTLNANGGHFGDNSTIWTQEIAAGNRFDSGYYIGNPALKGKKFSSWNTQADGQGQKITNLYDFVLDSDLTLYAQWEEAVNVRFNANGGYFAYAYSGNTEVYEYIAFKNESVISPAYNLRNSNPKVTFAGWSTEQNDPEGKHIVFAENTTYYPDKDITLYAVWKNAYIITFHANSEGGYYNYNGTSCTDFSVAIKTGDSITNKYYTPKYVNNDENYIFTGYNTKADGTGSVVNTTYIPSGDIDLYAQWDKACSITFMATDGYYDGYYAQQSGNSQSFTENYKKGSYVYLGTNNAPNIEGKRKLLGWSYTPGGKIENSIARLDKDIVLYAVWSDAYEIIFDGNGGKVRYNYYGTDTSSLYDSEKIYIAKGEAIIKSEDYRVGGYKDGYLLDGWALKPDGSNRISLYSYKPTGDTTIYAIWAKAYKVTYDANGGEFANSNAIETRQFKEDQGIVFPKVNSSNKGLSEWNTKADGSGDTVTENSQLKSDITVYAIWDDGYTVTLDAGSGQVVNPFSYYYEMVNNCSGIVAKGKSIDLPTCNWEILSSEGMFVGWYEDPDFQNLVCGYKAEDDNEYTPTKDITLYAKFEKGYKVTFNGNTGWVYNNDAKIYEVNIRKGDSVESEIYGYIEEGNDESSSTFKGWYKEPECKNLVATRETISSYVPDGDVTLYAGFEDGEVKVTGLTLSKTKATIGVGDSFKLQAIVKPSNATNRNVIYSSSNSTIATVDVNGTVTGVSQGEAFINVTTIDGGIVATCTLTVDGKNVEEIAGTIENAVDILEQQKVNGQTDQMKNTVKQYLGSLGTVESLADKTEANRDVASKLIDLENTYKEAAGIQVVEPSSDQETVDSLKEALGEDIDTSVTSVSAAALNAEPNQTAKLEIKPTAENDKPAISGEFNNATMIDMTLKVGENESTANHEVEKLVAPVTITLPLPRSIQRPRLYVLHFNADGTYELIKPVLSNNSMTITVSHFSTFAIVELAEGEAIRNNNNQNQNQNPANNQGNKPSGNNGNGNGSGSKTGNEGNNNASNNASNSGDSNSTNNNAANNSNNGNEGNSSQQVNPDAEATPGNEGDASSQNNDEANASAKKGTKATSGNATYKVTGDFEVTYTTSKNKKAKSIKVPKTIDIDGQKYTVTAISKNAFKNLKSLKSVTIPETVTKIEGGAFKGCKNLKTITIKSTKLTNVGKNAFKGINSKATIKVPKSKKKDYSKLFKTAKVAKGVKIK